MKTDPHPSGPPPTQLPLAPLYPGWGGGLPGTPGSLCISSTGAEPATYQCPAGRGGGGQLQDPALAVPLCQSAGGGKQPLLPLWAQLCPQQLLLPSVPPALKWVSPSQPPRERTGSVRAPRNQGAQPQDLGLLSTERAQVGAGFRELGALPGPCTTVEREGGPLPPQDSSLSAATLSSWGMGRGGGVPPSPWKRGHSQRAEAMQSSLEKQ